MGEMGSLWEYEENQEMEQQLEQKLLCTTLELEKLKAEAVDEMSKNKEYIKQLILLLKYAVQERDEARNQLNNLLATIPTAAALPFPCRTTNSTTDCHSPSDTYNSDTLSNNPANFDQGSLIIDGIVKGRPLPEKGKFLQAVLQAGPLLQTLLVAGPLPRWRNPPKIQPLQIPPVTIPDSQIEHRIHSSVSAYGQGVSCGTARGNYGYGSWSGSGSAMNYGGGGFGSLAKRQRFI